RMIVMPCACLASAEMSLSAAAYPMSDGQASARMRMSFFIRAPVSRILSPFRIVTAAADLLFDFQTHRKQRHDFEQRDERVDRVAGERGGLRKTVEALVETPLRELI